MIRLKTCEGGHLRDRGSALVAAMGVALIGAAFCTIVVAVAIGVTNDSARDRVRTIEVHAAESVLDSTLYALETSAPCTVADTVIGSGTTAVTVHTTISYFDASNLPLTTCTAGKIVGSPTKATVSATGTAAAVTASGIPPQRTIQAQVNIKPIVAESSGSAIFAGSSISTGGGFTVSPFDPTKRARVWLDSGNFDCSTSVTITGDLVVAQGSATLSHSSCSVTGYVWAKTGFTAKTTPTAPYSVGGNLTVYAGDVDLRNDNRFGGSVSVGGNVGSSYFWPRATFVGPTCYGTGAQKCATLTKFDPMGFPTINYVPSDFSALGFSGTPLPAGPSTTTSFESAIIKSWGFTPAAWQLTSQDKNPCSPVQSISTNPIRLPETGTSPTIYNCTAWGWGAGNGGGVVTLKLYADIVIYAKSFSTGNGLTIISGDGQRHYIYLIVPKTVAGLSGYAPGNMTFPSGGIQVTDPAAIFAYTPGTLTFPNTSAVTGQMYGGAVTVGANSGVFKYLAVPLPSGYLSGGAAVPAGYTVQVIDKSEQ